MTSDLQMWPPSAESDLTFVQKEIPQSFLVVLSSKGERDLLTLTSKTQQKHVLRCGHLNFHERPPEHPLSGVIKMLLDWWRALFSYLRKYTNLSLCFLLPFGFRTKPPVCNILWLVGIEAVSKRAEKEKGTNFFVIYQNKSTAAALPSRILANSNQSFAVWRRAEGSSRIQLLIIWRRIFSLFMDHKEKACFCQNCQKMTK